MTDSTKTEQEDHPEFTIVGIGASAGGLAALKTFFAQVPEDSGLAFVIVVHLAPDHESHLADLLQPHVKIPVQQVTETLEIKPNQVYVIPPGSNLSTIDTHLRLTKLEEKRMERAPIDHFFRTLAKTHDGSSVGVILTGTGSDGTLGIREIKEQGGLTVVQDPSEAEYDGMPQSAIATGLVDLILPLEKIPEAILRFARTEPRVPIPTQEEALSEDKRSLLQKIFVQVRARSGRDFSQYKQATILRRITRRMQLRQLEELSDYLELLQKHPEEVQALSDDMLITVTNFFRDPEVFDHLEKEVIPALFEGKKADDMIRIWSVGCATGEEAYSLTMILLEEAARREHPPGIQVFASDLHDHSLEKAREGFYPGDIKTDVSEERLKRFFVKEDSGYRIRKEVRELVIFTPHNLLGDPPFSRLDLISCRNVLIYLQRSVQSDVMELFHYALNGEGFLLLGTSETVEGSDLFRDQQKKICLYRKRNIQAAEPRLPVFPMTKNRMPVHLKHPKEEGEPVVYGALHYQMVEQYAPPSLLVSPDDQVVHFSERVGRYLVHPGGELTSSIYRLVRQELHIELRSLLYSARKNEQRLSSPPIPVQFNGHPIPVVLHANPSQNPKQKGFVLLIFEERPANEEDPEQAPPSEVIPTEVDPSEPHKSQVQHLENELYRTRQRLQAIIEEYEAGHEEMRASNEEMQSTNEELRSTLEELETSKEELQSMNEELQTVNQENRHKVEELSQLSNDLQSVLQATDIATLFLDRELRILRFTPRVGELFNVRLTDRGRPISDITHQLGYDDLQADAQKVLAKLVPIEREIRDEEHRWYITRVLPYRSAEDRIEGVVITFEEISARKRMEDDLREAKEFAESIIETLHEPLLVLTPDLRVKTVNQAFYENFEVNPKETRGQLVYDLGNGQWDIPELRTLLEDVLPENNVFNDFEVKHQFEQIGRRVMLLNARRLDHVQLILLGIRDITERKESEEAIYTSQLRLADEADALTKLNALSSRLWHVETLIEGLKEMLKATIDLLDAEKGNVQLLDNGVLKIVSQQGFSQDFLDSFREVTADDPSSCGRALSTLKTVIIEDVDTDETYTPLRPLAQKEGYRSIVSVPMTSRDETPLGVISTHFSSPHRPDEQALNRLMLYVRQASDFIERYNIEEALREAKDAAEEAAQAKADFLAHMSHEIRTPLNAVMGLSSLLLKQSHPEQEENLQTLKFSAESLKMLVNDILDFSKIQAGKVVVEEMAVNLAQLLRSLQKAHEPRAMDQANTLQFQVDEKIPEVILTDQLKLSQVLNNLIGNALKFTRKGEVTVDISLDRQEEDQLWITFSVQDTGVGIPPDKMDTIFEAFTQADISTVRQYGGTGFRLIHHQTATGDYG
jgi:two-component system CheB/CheR fusion protein